MQSYSSQFPKGVSSAPRNLKKGTLLLLVIAVILAFLLNKKQVAASEQLAATPQDALSTGHIPHSL